MSSDSSHHLIEKGMKAIKRVEDFGYFQKIIDNNIVDNKICLLSTRLRDGWPYKYKSS